MSDETNSNEMAEKLAAAGEKAENQRRQRRERVVKGSHLLGALTEKAKAAGLTLEEKNGFLKVNGGVRGKNVYIAKKGGRVDLSGFTVDASAVKQITEQEAREKHLGKVRGQLDFDKSDEEILSAFDSALTTLAAKSE